MIFIINRIQALKFAFCGTAQAFKHEVHLKIHALIAVLAIGGGFYFFIEAVEWFMILTAITLVICLEMINTAVEKLCDKLAPERDQTIKFVKDVTAGAVFVACIFAIIVGCIVFLPHVCSMP